MVNQQKNERPEEMDLYQFFKWIGRGLQRFGNAIILGLAALRAVFVRNRRFFLIMIFAGVMLGAAYHFFSKKKYESSMVLSCEYLNAQILDNHIDNLNALSEAKDKNGLAKTLGVGKETAEMIVRFDYEPFVSEQQRVENEVLKEQLYNAIPEKKNVADQVVAKLETYNKNTYRITVTMFDPGIVDTLETALIRYFSSNRFIERRLEATEQTLMARRAKLQRESRKLDSLKTVLFKNYQAMTTQSRGSNNVILGDEKVTNPLEVFKTDLDIHNEILNIEKQLFVGYDFEVIDSFTEVTQPANLGLAETLVLSAVLAALLGLVILWLISFNKLLARYA